MEKRIIIKGIESNYTVDECGNVYSLNYNKTKKKKKMKLSTDKDGYLKANFHINKMRFCIGVHILVANAFLYNDDPENKIQVNHLNGVKSDNNLYNLEWVTPSENIIHAYKTGLTYGKSGELSSVCIYDEELIKNICIDLESNNLTTKEISLKYNIKKSLVESIKYGRTWTTISKNYKIKNHNKKKELIKNVLKEYVNILKITYFHLKKYLKLKIFQNTL